MNIKRKFKKIFKVFLDMKKTDKILYLLQNLYNKKILDKELILNLIKGLIIIFYIDQIYFELYYEILDYFYCKMNKELQIKIVNTISRLDLSKQFEIDDYYIDKIIINTNNLFALVIKYDINLIFNIWIYVINQVKKNKLNTENKILLYSRLLKDSIYILRTGKIENESFEKIKNNINIIVNLIKKI